MTLIKMIESQTEKLQENRNLGENDHLELAQ